jgi:hypothetical protein
LVTLLHRIFVDAGETATGQYNGSNKNVNRNQSHQYLPEEFLGRMIKMPSQ